ncbi:MAG: hypothetical protein EBW84_13260, partial [Betaproteobacteria bacterium]|nr:hypothetical protein [Betaproteobacteria bacterium]
MSRELSLPSSPLIKQPWAAATNSARLFYNYLRLSPSYAAGLVHRSRSVVKRLNRQGQKVLACVKKYADVYKLDFDAWIKGPGLNRLTAPTLLPEIHTAASIKASDPSDLFVRFPKGKNVLPQLELLALINLWRDVYLSYLIKNYPETELWRLGAEAMLVDRFIGKVEPTGRRMNASQDHERRLLVATVIRHREWAHNVAEHAAVDRFPCKDAITHEQMYLALPAVDLTKQLADHAREES